MKIAEPFVGISDSRQSKLVFFSALSPKGLTFFFNEENVITDVK